MLERERKSTKIGLAMEVKIGIDGIKSVKNTYLLVIMRVKLSQKIGMLDLTNRT